MNPPGLPELKTMLLTSKSFADTWTYFLDHFAEKEEFVAQGARVEDELVITVISQVCAHLYPKAQTVSHLLLVRIAEQGFLHGGFRVAGNMGGVFYFDDIDMGLLAVGGETPKAHFARFSVKHLRQTPPPSMN